MKKNTLIILLLLILNPIHSQYFQKLGNGLSVKTFFHQQGINYYLHEMDSNGQVFAIYYDTVTSSFNFGHEYSQIRLQVFDGISWLFSQPVRLYNRYSIDAPRILDIKFHNNEIYVSGSFDSSQNNSGAGIIKFSNRTWQSCAANLLQTNPDYFEVNRSYSFQNQLFITGNFDSVPGVKVNGILLWNGSAWNPVGSAGNYGFRNLSGTSNVFFHVVNDSLYAYNKNKITPDSIEIGTFTGRKLAVFSNGQFRQINIPVKYIANLSTYKKQLVIIPSSSLVYTHSILLMDAGTWKTYILPDSFYATSFSGTVNNSNILYLLFQNGDTKNMEVYAFDGTIISKLPSFKISDNYLPVEFRNKNEGLTIAGNFLQVRKGAYSDSFNYITKVVFLPKAIFTGTTYLDLNNDQARQLAEPILPYCKVYSNDHQYMSLSDGSGKIHMILPVNQNFTLNSNNDLGYASNQSFVINTSKDSIYQADFGFVPSNNNDVSVKIFSQTANKAKQGFETSYSVHLNNYSPIPQSINIRISLDAKCNNIKFKAPIVRTPGGLNIITTINGQEKQSFTFSCVYAVDSFNLGEKVYTSAAIQLDDANKINNSDTVWQTVVAAFDPNIKVASPNVVVNKDKVINYTIFFQNLGNDTALNVTVLDSIGSLLDITKVVYHHAGPMYVKADVINNVIIWQFKHINLPPKKHDSIRSIGFINLSSSLNKNSKIGDTIFNKAAIFFDYQKPVITNKAKVVFVKNSSISGPDQVAGFNIYPNPGNGTFFYNNPRNIKGDLQVFSTDGKLVYSLKLLEQGEVRLPDTIAKGIYILKTTGTVLELGKIIVAE